MNKKFFTLLFAAVCLFAHTARAVLFKAEEFTLDNGLQCVVIENHKAPLVMQMLLYKAGSVDEKAGKGGSAHLLEHLMFRGTKSAKDGEFNRITEKYGASDNAFTSHDVTAYHQFADVRYLEIFMALEADRMENLDFDDKAFEAEKKIVYQERMQRIENDPSSPFYEKTDSVLWGDSPYGRPVTGRPQEILGLTSKDITDFYRKYYAPGNAVLVLAGDITAAEARPLVEKYYGGIKPREVKHEENSVQMTPFKTSLTVSLPAVTTAKIYNRCLLPEPKVLKDKVYDFAVLREYLGGGSTSALYKELVLNRKTALGVGAFFNFVTRGESVFGLSEVPQNGTDASEEAKNLQKAADKVVVELTEEKLAKTKRKMLADLVFVNDNPETGAEWAGLMLAAGYTLDEVQNYEQKLNAVTLQGVKKAYEMLKSAPCVRGVLLPQEEKTK